MVKVFLLSISIVFAIEPSVSYWPNGAKAAYSVEFDDFCSPGTYVIALKADTLFANRGLSF